MDSNPTKQQLDELFIYSPESGELRWKIRPANRVKVGDIAGTWDRNGHRQVKAGGRLRMVHQVIWCMMTGEWPTQHMNHINRVYDDNRFSNLELCTQADNMKNKSVYSNSKSGVAGVHATSSGCWAVRIGTRGFGKFATKEEAVVHRFWTALSMGYGASYGVPV